MNTTQPISITLRLVAASVLFTLAADSSATAQPPIKLREWKSSKGTTIQAAIYSFDEVSGVVTLLVPKEVKLNQLDPESRTLAKALASLSGLSYNELKVELHNVLRARRELEIEIGYTRERDVIDRRVELQILNHTKRAELIRERLIDLEEAGADAAEKDAAPKRGEKPDAGPAPGPDVEPVRRMTSATFSRLKDGMTFQQVVEIVGPPDEQVSSGGSGNARTVIYYWKIGEFGNAQLIFQGGKLFERAMLDL